MSNELIEYLDIAKEITGSDYKTAKALKVTSQYISQVRAGRGISPTKAMKLAEIINEPPLKVIAANERDRAKTPEDKAHWAKYLTVAGAALAVLALFDPLGFEGASMAYALGLMLNPSMYYASLVLGVMAALALWFKAHEAPPLRWRVS